MGACVDSGGGGEGGAGGVGAEGGEVVVGLKVEGWGWVVGRLGWRSGSGCCWGDFI